MGQAALTVAGFTTPEYADLAQECGVRLRARGLGYRLISVQSAGSWLGNVNLKPLAVALILATEPDGRRVLFLDVDAEVVALPDELPPGDFLAYQHTRPSGARELCSGTLLLRNTVETRRVVAA